MTVHDKYEIEIDFELDEISQKTELGSEEHRKAAGDIAQLTDRLIRLKEVDIEQQKIEIEKARAEADKEKAKLELEKIEIERQKMIEEKQDRKIKNGLSALGIVLPIGFTLTGMVLMFLFEEKGTIVTSGPGRKIVDRMFRI